MDGWVYFLIQKNVEFQGCLLHGLTAKFTVNQKTNDSQT